MYLVNNIFERLAGLINRSLIVPQENSPATLVEATITVNRVIRTVKLLLISIKPHRVFVVFGGILFSMRYSFRRILFLIVSLAIFGIWPCSRLTCIRIFSSASRCSQLSFATSLITNLTIIPTASTTTINNPIITKVAVRRKIFMFSFWISLKKLLNFITSSHF